MLSRKAKATSAIDTRPEAMTWARMCRSFERIDTVKCASLCPFASAMLPHLPLPDDHKERQNGHQRFNREGVQHGSTT